MSQASETLMMKGGQLSEDEYDYCVAKCDAKTKNVGDITIYMSKNNRRMRRSTCGTCGSRKNRCLKSK